jgi:hypothetical protein
MVEGRVVFRDVGRGEHTSPSTTSLNTTRHPAAPPRSLFYLLYDIKTVDIINIEPSEVWKIAQNDLYKKSGVLY